MLEITQETFYFSLAMGVLMGAWGNYIADKKNRSRVLGFSLGFLFGILGVIVMYFIPAQPTTEETDREK